jgi:serine/threonine protein kinase
MDEAPKNLRNGRYAVVRLLGEGAQAATFEAVDKKEGRPVAIKRFRVRGAKSWKEVELAEREARVLSSLSHPGLPRYVEHFEEGGELFLVTEKIEGESIAALRKRSGALSDADVVRFLHDVSVILDYLHGRAPPVVHRDIKPSNVLRRPDGSYVLIDFGAVRDKMKPEGGSTVVGTFGYMGPEQFQGRAMPASDVYAVGATALAMLTGNEPEDLPHKGLAIDVASAVGRGTNPTLARALAAMLEPDPDKRPNRIAPLLEGLSSPSREKNEKKPKTEAGEARAQEHPRRQHARRGPPSGERIAREIETEFDRGIDEAVRHFEKGFSQFEEEWSRRREERKPRSKSERRAEKAARKAERRSSRHERRAEERATAEERFVAAGPMNGLLVAFLLFGLTIGQVAVTVTLRALVPVLLTMLSLVFGKGLRDASKLVNEAGKTASASMERVKELIRARAEGAPIDTRPVEPSEGAAPRVRVRVDEQAKKSAVEDTNEDDALAEEEAAEAEAKKKGQRRS